MENSLSCLNRLMFFNERMTKPFEWADVFNKQVTKLFKWAKVFDKRITEAIQTDANFSERLTNGKCTVHFPVEGHN